MHDVDRARRVARGDQRRGRAPDAGALRARSCRSSTAPSRRCGGSPARSGSALASSSNRPLIDAVLAAAGLATLFEATVSSEEVPRGKPAPDVYLEAARRLGVAPERLRRGRGLGERDPRGARSRDARDRDPEPALPAAGGRARARGRRLTSLEDLTVEAMPVGTARGLQPPPRLERNANRHAWVTDRAES